MKNDDKQLFLEAVFFTVCQKKTGNTQNDAKTTKNIEKNEKFFKKMRFTYCKIQKNGV